MSDLHELPKEERFRHISVHELEQLADEYLEECMTARKEQATAKGDVIKVAERHIPTVEYFLNIWIPLVKFKNILARSTYYDLLKKENGSTKSDTIKKIDEKFKTLAVDIVANEGKGIFYAKNRLGMHDRIQNDISFIEQPIFNLSDEHTQSTKKTDQIYE